MGDEPRDLGDAPPRTLVEERHPVPHAEQRLDWRQGYVAADGLIVLLGLWLVVSPLVIDYGSDDATWNPIVCGVLMVAAAVAGLVGVLSRTAAVAAVLGIAVWLFASGFWLADSVGASWNAWAGGAVAAFLAIAAAAAVTSRQSE